MTLYSSKTPRDLNENRRGKPSYSHFGMVRQHNAPNPVLTLFRKQRIAAIPIRSHALGFLNGITRLISEGFSVAQIDHARRVLTRLAALS